MTATDNRTSPAPGDDTLSVASSGLHAIQLLDAAFDDVRQRARAVASVSDGLADDSMAEAVVAEIVDPLPRQVVAIALGVLLDRERALGRLPRCPLSLALTEKEGGFDVEVGPAEPAAAGAGAPDVHQAAYL